MQNLQDARELDASKLIRSTFGEDWGSVSLIYSTASGADILTEPLLTGGRSCCTIMTFQQKLMLFLWKPKSELVQ